MPGAGGPPGRGGIDAALVRELLATQLPRWADLPLRAVEPGGWDNRTFRLGDELLVRLPSAAAYAAQVEKEQRWLPRLAPLLPLPVPEPVAMGAPSDAFPWPWSVLRWIEGEPAAVERIADLPRFAAELASFLRALQRIEPAGGPAPGPHNFWRGAPPAVYDDETRRALATLRGVLDAERVAAVWEAALAAPPPGPPAWLHGDVAASNLLVRGGRLRAVIDFGCTGVGDPACDLTIAWTFFSGESRAAFREALPADAATWARARGWALWKALITLADALEVDAEKAATARRVIEAVLAEHEGSV